MNIRGSHIGFLSTAIRVILLGLLLAGCTTVQTERTSVDQGLRSRTVRGPSGEIFKLVERCVYREFPNDVIRSDAAMGEIVVADYSLVGGDAVIKFTVTGWPDDRVEVNVSATGLGAAKQRTVVGRFLGDFDQEYADWAKDRMVDRRAVE